MAEPLDNPDVILNFRRVYEDYHFNDRDVMNDVKCRLVYTGDGKYTVQIGNRDNPDIPVELSLTTDGYLGDCLDTLVSEINALNFFASVKNDSEYLSDRAKKLYEVLFTGIYPEDNTTEPSFTPRTEDSSPAFEPKPEQEPSFTQRSGIDLPPLSTFTPALKPEDDLEVPNSTDVDSTKPEVVTLPAIVEPSSLTSKAKKDTSNG